MAGEPLTRRAFLGGALALGAGAVVPRPARAPLLVRRGGPAVPADPFTLGVASGDPTTTGVMLWTRLAPDPQSPGGGMAPERVRVRWEVATDERFTDLVRSGGATAVPAAAHSVHADVDGLDAGRDYFYRFRAGNEESPVGRTRTAPAGPRPVRLGVASCQDYETGLYVAHRHLAEEDLDAVLFLGDYIYENGVTTGSPRLHEGPEPTDLEGYRRRYATYKADADLQASHAAHPWVVTWDDHEVENNYADGLPQGHDDGPVPEFVTRRAAAYRAWWEHQPVRLGPPPASGPYRIHRRVRLGALADVLVLDTRQHRTNQPCGSSVDIGGACTEVDSPGATMLGASQRDWLLERLGERRARWTLVAQQVMMAQANFAPGIDTGVFNLDQWDAYRVERARVLDAFSRASNPVVLTGDIHSAWTNDLLADFDDPASPAVGTELVGTSISSSFPLSSVVAGAVAGNPHVRYFEGGRRGYLRCTLDRRELRADHRYVSGTDDPAATIETGASFVVEAGAPGARPA